MARPTPPSGKYALKDTVYAVEDTNMSTISDLEFAQGRNMVGEPETLLGSVPNAHKENWMFSYLNEHIKYLTEMVEYLEEQMS